MDVGFWIISASVVSAAILIAYFILRFMHRRRIRIILSTGRARDDFLTELYKTAFGRKCYILENVYIPVRPGKDSELCRLPLVLIGNGGIMIFEKKRMSGFIENPMRGDWRLFSGKRITQFQNPVERNTIHARALKKLIRAHNLPVCNIKGLVVLTEGDVRLKNKLVQVVSAEASLECIDKTMKHSEITSKDARRIAILLRRSTDLACRRGAQ